MDRPSISLFLFWGLLAAVGACRLAELRISKRNQRALAARGAPPLPEPLFRAMVALHTGVLIAAALEVSLLARPATPAIAIPALALVALSNLLRVWVIATLGAHWNVRVVRSMPFGVVTGGPYRWIRHPNYVAVFVELTALPLVHGAFLTAIIGAALHLAILRRRIALEESVLMTDPDYRKAFADKPRFLPWPT